MFPNWLVPGAIRAVLSRAPFMRLAMLTIGLLLPISASAYWLTPSNAVADSQKSYRLEWGGNAGSSGAMIQVQAPGSSTWDGAAYVGSGNSSGSCNRPFPVAGTWKARVVSMQYGSVIDSTFFSVAPNTISTTFSFGNLSHTYDGNTKTATVTPTPSNAQYTCSLTSSSGAPGTYTVTATATAPYTGSGSATLTIDRAGQSISFGNPGPKVYGFPVTLSATATSGLPVTFSVVAGSATISGNVVTATGAGNVTIRASQAGNSNFYAATSVDNTFVFTNTAPTNRELNLAGALIYGAQGETALYLGDSVTVTGIIDDVDGNLTAHTISVSSDGAQTWAPLTEGTPSNRTTSSKSVSYTPTRAGRWDFNSNGTDGLIWPTGASKTLWVYGGVNDALFLSQTVDGAVNPTALTKTGGASIPVLISMRNNGSRVWNSDAHPHKLKALVSGWGVSEIALPSGVTVYAPPLAGNDVTFTFNVIAPTTPGVYQLKWQMVENLVGAPTVFGPQTPTVTVTVPDTTAPSVPTGLRKVAVTSTTASLAWTASADNVGVTGYRIYKGGVLLASTAGTTYTATGLTAGTTYNFAVSCYDAAGNESALCTALPVVPPVNHAPAAPTLTIGSVTATGNTVVGASKQLGDILTIDLSGTDSDSNLRALNLWVLTPATGIWRNVRSDNTLNASSVESQTTDTVVNSATDVASLTKRCTFTVSAADGLGTMTIATRGIDSESSVSVTSYIQIPLVADTTPPSVPTNLGATSSSATSITLAWTASSDNSGQAPTYEIYDASRNMFLGTTTSTTWTHSGLAEGSVYLYKVCAKDIAGNYSVFTTSVMGTTVASDTSPALTYNPYRNPNRTAVVSVRAQGTGTVVLHMKDATADKTMTFSFVEPAGDSSAWVLATLSDGTPMEGKKIELNTEVDYTVQVVSSTVGNFYVSLRDDPEGWRRDRSDLFINGLYIDQINKNEAGSSFTIRASHRGALPFGLIDTSGLATGAPAILGLGSDARGRSAGVVTINSIPLYQDLSGANMWAVFEKGPATISFFDTTDHVQALVPSGLVDVQRLLKRVVVRFYTGSSFTKSGDYYVLPSGQPTVYYQIDTVGGRRSIKRAVDGEVMQYLWDLRGSLPVLIRHNESPMGNLIYYNEGYKYETTIDHWSWHRIGAPLPGLVRYRYYALQQKSWYGNGGATLGPLEEISLTQTAYSTSSATGTVLHTQVAKYATEDRHLTGGVGGMIKGVDGDKYYDWDSAGSNSFKRNNFGGGSVTEFYRTATATKPTNLGGQPMGALGKPREVRTSFGDDSPPDLRTQETARPGDLVTLYTYIDALGGAKTLVESATTTTQGSKTIGQRTYAYAVGSFDGKETEQTTTNEWASSTPTDHLTTTRLAYSSRVADSDFRDRLLMETKPDGSRLCYAYQRGTLSGSSWTPSTYGAHLLIAELVGKSGSSVTSYRGITVPSLDMESTKSTANERIVDSQGRSICEATYVYQGSNAFSLITSVYSQYDQFGNLIKKSDQPISANGATTGRTLYEATYSGFKKVTERDETGVLLTTTYDDYGRIATVTRASAGSDATGDFVPERTTTYGYDGYGRVVSETVSSPASNKVLLTTRTYDTASRIKTTTQPGGYTTSTVYTTVDDLITKATVTTPAGGTIVTEYFHDGRIKKSYGTAVAESTNTYAYNGVGNLVTTTTKTGITPSGYSVLAVDWLGREVSTTATGWNGSLVVSTPTYAPSGQIAKKSITSGGTKLGPDRLFAYDSYGRLFREASDTNNNGNIDLDVDTDVKEYEFNYQQTSFNRLGTTTPMPSGNAWYRVDGVKVYPYGGTNSSTARYASQTYTQVSGLSASHAAHTYAYDFDRNVTQTFVAVDRSAREVTTTTLTTGTTQAMVQRALNGQVMESTNAQGHRTELTYDGLGRLIGSVDPRLGANDPLHGLTITTYLNGPDSTQTTTLVASVTTPDSKTTSFGYDAAGRQNRVTAPDAKVSYCQYDKMGNLTHAWGDTVNPVKYGYDEQGHRTEMQTYRSGAWTDAGLPAGFAADGDKTIWYIDSYSGLLASKADALDTASNPRRTTYTYDAAGRVLTRTDARGVVTTYAYNGTAQAGSGQFNGLLSTVSYSVGSSGAVATTTLVYTYDRNGKIKTVDDAAGRRTLDYYESCDSLQGYSTRLKSETLPAAFFGSRTLAYEYQYDSAGHRNGADGSVQYGAATDYRVAYGYDGLLRLNQVTSSAAQPFTYTYTDNANHLARVAQTSGYARDYTYETTSNRLSDLNHSWGLDTDRKVTASYQYNNAGLRSVEKTDGINLMALLQRSSGLYADFTYTDRREVDVTGQFDLTAAWAKGAAVAGATRDYNYDPIGNRTADQSGAYTPNALNQYSAAPGIASLTYDLTGNLTGDGTRSYTYDAENRLASVTQAGTTTTFKYDYLGRRISKQVGTVAEVRFVYDGWNLIAELDGSTLAIQRTYTWGLDASGGLQAAGGVGGLLCIASGSNRYYPIYDGSYNVTGLYDGTGAIAAAYRYDPFGNLLQSAGVAAAVNPFGFSTKFTDRETGLLYYGLRYYHPRLGRFINRDPLEEQGGINLYAFCSNDGVNRWDYLGLNNIVEEGIQKAQQSQAEADRKRAAGLTPDGRVPNTGEPYVEPETGRWQIPVKTPTGVAWVDGGSATSEASERAQLRQSMDESFTRSQMENTERNFQEQSHPQESDQRSADPNNSAGVDDPLMSYLEHRRVVSKGEIVFFDGNVYHNKEKTMEAVRGAFDFLRVNSPTFNHAVTRSLVYGGLIINPLEGVSYGQMARNVAFGLLSQIRPDGSFQYPAYVLAHEMGHEYNLLAQVDKFHPEWTTFTNEDRAVAPNSGEFFALNFANQVSREILTATNVNIGSVSTYFPPKGTVEQDRGVLPAH